MNVMETEHNEKVQPFKDPTADISPMEALFGISKNAGSKKELLEAIGSTLLADSNVGYVFHVELPSQASGQCEIDLLASRYSSVAANLEQWAANIGLKCCTSGLIQKEVAASSDSTNIQMIGAPVADDPSSGFESIVVMFFGEDIQSSHLLALVQTAAIGISKWNCDSRLEQANQLVEDLAAINELVARIETADSPERACQRLVNEVEKFICLEKGLGKGTDVYVALSDNQANFNLTAVSNTNAIPQDSQRVEFVESAMRECVSRNQSTAWPPVSTDRHALLCHRQFAQRFAKSNVLSILLYDREGELQGVMLTASGTIISDRVKSFLKASATPISCSLSLMKRAQKNQLQRWLANLSEAVHEKKLKTVIKCTFILMCLTLIPLPYTVSSKCEVQPSVKRFVAAPFAAKLQECLVEPGDTVVQNQVLARIDDQEIKLELAEIEAELHRAMKTRDGHVAAHESGEAKVAHFETERLRAHKELLECRNDNRELKSPVDGIVISGDLKKAEGMPLETGQALFEIAPLEDLMIELSIPEDDVRYVEPGMFVRIRLDAFPFESWTGTVERVHPAAEIRDSKNVFVATVKIANESGKLRPGMQGNGKTRTVWRPICWNWFHKPVANGLRWIGW
jgi:hypothetical protein